MSDERVYKESVTFFHNANRKKAEACLRLIGELGGSNLTKAMITAILFLADNQHAIDHHRPLYGEVWIRTPYDSRAAVHGVILSALLKDRHLTQDPQRLLAMDLADARNRTSISDGKSLEAAYKQVRAFNADGYADAIAAVRATKLWGNGQADLPVDYNDTMDPTLGADPEYRSDRMFMMVNCAF